MHPSTKPPGALDRLLSNLHRWTATGPSPQTRAARQSILFRQHLPPRYDPAALSWFGGLPLVPDTFVWPRTNYKDRPSQPLSFVMQIDCAAIDQAARLDLLPNRGLLQFFMDLDWGKGFGFSVQWCDAAPQKLRLATPPADLPPLFGTESRYHNGWFESIEDSERFWPKTLPRWSFDPLTVAFPNLHRVDEETEELYTLPPEAELAAIIWAAQSDPRAIHKKESPHDAQGRLLRPFTNYPHDWRAIQICAGLTLRRLRDRYRPSSEKALPNLPSEAQQWFDRATGHEPFAPLTPQESDAFWRWAAENEDVLFFTLPNACRLAIEATITHSAEAAARLPEEALALIRTRHALAVKHEVGFWHCSPARMLAPPSLVQDIQWEMAPSHLLLLELSTNEGLSHSFGEGVFQFWITPDDLRSRRFDKVRLTAEAY